MVKEEGPVSKDSFGDTQQVFRTTKRDGIIKSTCIKKKGE